LAGSDAEQGHKEKLVRYSDAKRHQKTVLAHIVDHEPLLFKEAEALQACGSWLTFRNFYTIGQYRLISGCSCKKHLLCGLCALRRAAKQVKSYEAKLYQVLKEKPLLKPFLITLTVKNGSDLGERTKHLCKAIRSMTAKRRNAKAGSRNKTIFSLIAGAAGAFEFKKGTGSNLWHPHIHMLALLSEDIDIGQFEANLSREWLKMTKDSHQVNAKPINMESETSRFGAICEVFRYALKFGEMDIEDQIHAYKVLHGQRFVFSFGALHGVQIPDNDNDTIEDSLALLPYIDIVYKFIDATGFTFFETTDLGRNLEKVKKENPVYHKKVKKLRKFAKKKTVHVMDQDTTADRQLTVDMKYMKNWVAEADLEDTYQETVAPF
jgi:plasmid rolling circle replication initiator protein Rep